MMGTLWILIANTAPGASFTVCLIVNCLLMDGSVRALRLLIALHVHHLLSLNGFWAAGVPRVED
jgi:hypothetical protein